MVAPVTFSVGLQARRDLACYVSLTTRTPCRFLIGSAITIDSQRYNIEFAACRREPPSTNYS
jgi:hypothetical protein